MGTSGKAVGGAPRWLVLSLLALIATTNAQSDTAWLFRYPHSEPLAFFADDTGNVYIAGWSEKSEDHRGVLLLKIDSLGHLLWDRTYNNVTAAGAARDTAGNVYITGFANDTSDGWLHTLKYTPNGDLDWARIYGEPPPRYQYSYVGSMVIDDSQNVYVSDRAESASCAIVQILKYRPDGMLARVMSYALGETMSLSWGGRFHVLRDGGAYLAMSIAFRPKNWPGRRLTVRLSSEGDVLWQRIYRDGDSTWDDVEWSQVDDSANIYITGTATRPRGFRTVKMDPSGKVIWTRLYWFSENTEGGRGFLLLHKGNVYVASGSDTVRLVKYDSLGNQLWLNKYGNGAFELGYGQGYGEAYPDFCPVSVDDSGNVYITGTGLEEHRIGKGHAVDSLFAFLLKYDPQGHLAWEKRRPWTNMRPDGLFDVDWCGAIVGFDKKGALYDIGVVRVSTWERGIYVLKYRTR
jgi:hypothetical protein